jgi:hypothetical protein
MSTFAASTMPGSRQFSLWKQHRFFSSDIHSSLGTMPLGAFWKFGGAFWKFGGGYWAKGGTW